MSISWRQTLLLNAVAVILLPLAAPALAQPAGPPPLPRLMTPRSIASAPAATPDQVLGYGEAEVQKAELFLPRPDPANPDALRPVVVTIHGGCWVASTAGREQMRAAAASFLDKGFAVWNIGYRRVDEPGGGYPGTFQDVAKALDLLREQAEANKLDLQRVILFGHSAGAHLALWAAGRAKLPADSVLRSDTPLKPRGVVGVGSIGDLKWFADQVDPICAPGTLAKLVGLPAAAEAVAPAAAEAAAEGATVPAEAAAPIPRADPFADTSPAALLPTGVPIVLLHGVYDSVTYPYVGLQFAMAARKAGDRADIQIAPMAGHFEVVVPGTPAFAQALAAVERLAR